MVRIVVRPVAQIAEPPNLPRIQQAVRIRVRPAVHPDESRRGEGNDVDRLVGRGNPAGDCLVTQLMRARRHENQVGAGIQPGTAVDSPARSRNHRVAGRQEDLEIPAAVHIGRGDGLGRGADDSDVGGRGLDPAVDRPELHGVAVRGQVGDHGAAVQPCAEIHAPLRGGRHGQRLNVHLQAAVLEIRTRDRGRRAVRQHDDFVGRRGPPADGLVEHRVRARGQIPQSDAAVVVIAAVERPLRAGRDGRRRRQVHPQGRRGLDDAGRVESHVPVEDRRMLPLIHPVLAVRVVLRAVRLMERAERQAVGHGLTVVEPEVVDEVRLHFHHRIAVVGPDIRVGAGVVPEADFVDLSANVLADAHEGVPALPVDRRRAVLRVARHRDGTVGVEQERRSPAVVADRRVRPQSGRHRAAAHEVLRPVGQHISAVEPQSAGGVRLETENVVHRVLPAAQVLHHAANDRTHAAGHAVRLDPGLEGPVCQSLAD